MSSSPQRRFHRERRVRLHSSGRWVCTIGKNYSEKGRKLVDADHYFSGTREQATAKANAKAREWELLCENWERTEQTLLEMIGAPLPAEPRWNVKSKDGVARPELTPEQLDEIRREINVPDEEFVYALRDHTLADFIPFYEHHRRGELERKELRHSSLSKTCDQMRSASRFFESIPARELTGRHFRDAKQKMHRELERRTVRNYMQASCGPRRCFWLSDT